jgi:general secretion pathway protein G
MQVQLIANKEEKMKWFCNRIYRKQKGFTLVELMIVIIILAVLTGIAIPSYLALRNRARIQATRSEMANVGSAIEMFAADTDLYPLTANYPAGITGGGYMNPVPGTDAWGNAYVYVSADGSTYTLTSLGSDGAAGGTGSAADIVLTDGQLN